MNTIITIAIAILIVWIALILLSIVALAIWSFIRIPIDIFKTIFGKG